MAASVQEKEDSLPFNSISRRMLNHRKAYNEVQELTKTIGHRLSR